MSRDRDQPAFERYFTTMDWLAVPFDSSLDGVPLRDQLDAHFAIDAIPTVVMLERAGPASSTGLRSFTRMPHNGRALLSKAPTTLAVEFPWSGRLVQRLESSLDQLERNASLVVLCEHLLSDSADYQALEDAVQQAAQRFAEAPEVVVRPPKWPRLKFVVAPGPPSAHSRWLREACGLPSFEQLSSKDALQVFILDRRPMHLPASYMMKGVCDLERLPYDLPALTSNGGKRLSTFLEVFCKSISPLEGGADASSPYQMEPVRIEFKTRR